MKLTRKFDKKEDVPSGLEELYVEKDGAFVLDGIVGMDVFAFDKQVKDRDDQIKTMVEEKTALEAEKSTLAANFDALKKEKGSKDSAVELAQLRREKDEAETKVATLEAAQVESQQKIKANEIRKHLEPVVNDLVIDNATVRKDMLDSIAKDFALTESGQVLTVEGLGEQAFMKPADYVANYLKDRAVLAKASSKDNINDKSDFVFKPKTKENESHNLDDAPSISDLIAEVCESK